MSHLCPHCIPESGGCGGNHIPPTHQPNDYAGESVSPTKDGLTEIPASGDASPAPNEQPDNLRHCHECGESRYYHRGECLACRKPEVKGRDELANVTESDLNHLIKLLEPITSNSRVLAALKLLRNLRPTVRDDKQPVDCIGDLEFEFLPGDAPTKLNDALGILERVEQRLQRERHDSYEAVHKVVSIFRRALSVPEREATPPDELSDSEIIKLVCDAFQAGRDYDDNAALKIIRPYMRTAKREAIASEELLGSSARAINALIIAEQVMKSALTVIKSAPHIAHIKTCLAVVQRVLDEIGKNRKMEVYKQ